MEAEFPQSAREAQEHIRAIRRDKGLGDGPDQIGNNAADLEAALQVYVVTFPHLCRLCSHIADCQTTYTKRPHISS